MSEDDDSPDQPTREELEMRAEEKTGHAFHPPGPIDAAERVQALQRRIKYLEGLLGEMGWVEELRSAGGATEPDPMNGELLADLKRAREQLAQWQAQDQGRN